jgi:hypothetical protein
MLHENALSNLAYRHPKHTPAARPKNQPTSHGAGISRGAAGALLGIRRVTTVHPDPTTGKVSGGPNVSVTPGTRAEFWNYILYLQPGLTCFCFTVACLGT